MDQASIAGAGRSASVQVKADEPWEWLAAGWRDMLRAPYVSLAYGGAFAIVSVVLTTCLFLIDLMYLLFPLGAGFMLVGPMLAVGLYEASRRLELDEPVTLADVAFVVTRSPAQLAMLGALLTLLLLFWVRLATLVYALFFGLSAFPGFEESVRMLIFTPEGLAMLAVGSVLGGVLAVAVFAISAFSVPILMTRDVDVITAILESVKAVRDNFWPMVVWAWLIAMLTIFGIATLFVGLAITFPLIGHATWHAYRRVIGDGPEAG
ncbi:MAG: DUF2189 domain-containing protein [Rhodospirillaceae bacterium]|nr:DUF2189 domain-containing protein [Rhodospirillaceae bacterium]